jgi:hypothetical protein
MSIEQIRHILKNASLRKLRKRQHQAVCKMLAILHEQMV